MENIVLLLRTIGFNQYPLGQLEDMHVFIRVVEAGGIGRAAEQLGLAKSAVSRRLSERNSNIDPILALTSQLTTATFYCKWRAPVMDL